MTTRRRTSAFTIVELLVVVSIVALLVSIAMVAYSKVTSMARTTTCVAHQREIALAQSSYATDQGGALTSPCTSFRGTTGAFSIDSPCGTSRILLNGGRMTNESYHSWVASYPGRDAQGNQRMTGAAENEGALTDGRLFSYVGSTGAYRSPLDPTGRLRSYSINCFIGTTVPNDVAAYAQNWVGWYCGQSVSVHQWKSTHLSHIRKPSSTIMSIVEQDGDPSGHNGHGWVIDPRPPEGSVAPPGTPNPGAWTATGWQGWIDTPAMWNPDAITYSLVDGSTATYSFQSAKASAEMQAMQAQGQSHGYSQPPDPDSGALRRDWMHFRDRLLPGVIPAMIPPYQQ